MHLLQRLLFYYLSTIARLRFWSSVKMQRYCLMLLSSHGLITAIHCFRDFQIMLLGNCLWHFMLPWWFKMKLFECITLVINLKCNLVIKKPLHINYYMHLEDLRTWLKVYHGSNHFAVLIFPVDHLISWVVLLKSIRVCTSWRE